MNDDPSEQAAESARRAADTRHQGETKPQAHLIVHATLYYIASYSASLTELVPLLGEASALAGPPNQLRLRSCGPSAEERGAVPDPGWPSAVRSG